MRNRVELSKGHTAADAGRPPKSHHRLVRELRGLLRFGRRGIYGIGLILLALVLVNGPTAAQQTGTIQLATASLPVGASLSLRAIDSQGQPVSGASWSSSNTSVATVSSTGVVTTRAAGQVTVRAQSSTLSATIAIAVMTGENPTPEPPSEEPPPTETPLPTEPPPPPSGQRYVWISPAELAARPTSGAAWTNLVSAASKTCSTPNLSNQDDPANVCVMAKALVYARTGDLKRQLEVVDALWDVVSAGTYNGRALALGRELAAYVIAADLINLRTFDPSLDSRFRETIARLRTTPTTDGPASLVECHELRPNNWGAHCGASRAAVAAYLGDTAELARTAQVFKGYLGDRASYAGFKYGELSWQCDASRPVGVNPKGCTKNGRSVDGVMPDDQRRAGGFTWPPPKENYAYEGLQGLLAQALILHRAGYDVFNWQDAALLRAFQWLHTQANFPAEGDDSWEPHLVNHMYKSSFPAPLPSRPGKNVGWTDWTHGK